MRLQRILSGAALLTAMVFGLLGVSPARARPAAPRIARSLTASQVEITKVTLGDTSIDGPALWTTTSGTVRGVLAWAGTDPSHSLNVITTAIGTSFGNKVTLPETSPARPAVARNAAGKVAVAWIGTDPAHTLNVLYDVYGARTKLTLWGDTSGYSPALVSVNSTLLLAWTGTDPGHSLNVLVVNANGVLRTGAKTTLWSFGALSGPSLSYEASRSEYILAWSATSPAARVTVSKSSNGTSWATPTALAEWSYETPSAIGIVGNYYTMPPNYLAWTGTDPARSLNFQYTRTFPSFPDAANTKVTLAETAYRAPMLGFISGPGLVLTAWTGTDVAHHLNLAVLTPMAPSPCAPPGIGAVTPKVISQGPGTRREVALTFDAGGETGRPEAILGALESAGVHAATFFFTAEWAQAHPQIVTRVKDDGFVIGNHTVDHPYLASTPRSDNYICYQLGLANQIIADRAGISGTRPYFRPPYGDSNAQVVNRAAGIGYYTVMWSLNTHDDQAGTTGDQIIATVKAELGPGKLILMHLGSAHEPEALADVLAYIKNSGYSFVTLDQLMVP